MKKVLITALVLFLSFGLFAADPEATLTLQTEIEVETLVKISQGTAALTMLTFDGYAIPDGYVTIPKGDLSVTDLYVNIKTNNKTGVDIYVQGPHMTASGLSTVIEYSIVNGNTSIASGGESRALLHEFDTSGISGLSVLSQQFAINLVEATHTAAIAGTYQATVNFYIDAE